VAPRSVTVAVVGLGAMGSMALWRLARRGIRCVGFEQFEPGHDRGSSTGETRIFRTAYFEAPVYVPLLLAALPLWRELESQTGSELLRLTGGLMIGRADGRIVAGTLASVREHSLPHEVLDARDMAAVHPRHVLEADEIAVWEPNAGFARPELSIRAAAARAAALGAEIVEGARVKAVERSGGGLRIGTDVGGWQAERVVLAAGAWIGHLAPELPLEVERVVQAWYAVDEPAAFAPDRFPVFIHDLGRSTRYGIPSIDGRTIKVAGHGGGGAADPDHLDREARAEDWSGPAEFVATRLRGVESTPTRTRVCMYTNSPDGNFVLGEQPSRPGALVVSPCSGHGFKFAPILGEIAARWALGEDIPYDLTGFGLRGLAAIS
jgi:sarcosine oxidase